MTTIYLHPAEADGEESRAFIWMEPGVCPGLDDVAWDVEHVRRLSYTQREQLREACLALLDELA